MKAKILVSDDEKIWREDILGNLLRDTGYVVHTASTIEETIELIQRNFFHLVTIDLMFSEDHSIVEGKRTMSLLKKLNEGTKAIVLSGHGTVDLAVEALKDFEVFHFLQKGDSFAEKNFLNIVDNAIKQVQISAVNYRLTIPVETVISGFKLQDIASLIGEKKDEVRWLILNLMNDIVPAIFSDVKGDLINADKRKIFKRQLWSRLLGKPLNLFVGHIDAMEKCLDTTSPIISHNNTEKAFGCLIEAVDVSFDKYRNLNA